MKDLEQQADDFVREDIQSLTAQQDVTRVLRGPDWLHDYIGTVPDRGYESAATHLTGAVRAAIGRAGLSVKAYHISASMPKGSSPGDVERLGVTVKKLPK